MIKLACLSLSYKRLFLENKMDFFDFIKQAYDLKFDGVDFNSKHIKSTNKDYLRKIKQECIKHGLVISGINKELKLVEIIENPDHPWFIASQFHPELKSRLNKAHPLFRGFIGAAVKYNRSKI